MSAVSAAAPGFARLARFRLLRELGRGAQARVMLAHDPRLDREVALKLLNPSADADAVHEWLDEARAVSRIAHPNVVPVFEADEHDGQPYLVFEYVEGPTLSQARRGKGAMPARDAVQLMLGVLDALAAAHAQHLVHRDLKPSNILLGSDGRPRVMDFGIAARVHQADRRETAGMDVADGRIVGTPGYMSPEAARGEPPVPAMDVFAAGMLLGELLAGAPLLRETDPYRAVQRIQAEDMHLAAGTRGVDSVLRGIVQRAVSRDLRQRYDSASAMRTALDAWLNPPEAAEPGADSHATLEFLLRRMRHKSDFPALSASVARIQRVACSDNESSRSLTDAILEDVALTNKLLRMCNTAHFSAVAGEGIGTVSRAVALVGFAGIRNMALSVVLLEHMGDKAHAGLLKEEFLRALMAGTMAEELSPPSRAAKPGEEAFLAALFQNLGRLLAECYFPEEATQIRQRLGANARDATPADRDAAARHVLGLGLADLGAGVAKAWGLPDSLQRALRAPAGDVPAKAIDRRADGGVERMRWLARGANAMADAMLSGDGDAQARALAEVAERFSPALGIAAKDLIGAVHGARTRLTQLASAMGLHVAAGAPARRLLEATAEPTQTAAPTDARTIAAAASAAQQQLSQTLADVRAAVASRSMRVNEVLTLVLDTMQRALGLRSVVFCLREAGSGQLVGRVGLGGGTETCGAFRFKPDVAVTGDLFAWLAAKGADLLISDARTVAARLPAWYRQRVNAPTFLLLPVMLKGAPIGMIYADKAAAGAIVLGEQELGLLRGLRDQVAAAFAAR